MRNFGPALSQDRTVHAWASEITPSTFPVRVERIPIANIFATFPPPTQDLRCLRNES
jgi:hypothetical protein